ncbi:MAG: NAD(P)H-quinone dehydrogenase [Micrococcales bacterium]|nr:MAG: NAD(P)H-quinone dehydrogenase [Micrococcales bacterium]PIE28020.1 MAG: NAD(P)H-quinone dehydrogenase [Micrococcales bacterium]
MVPVNTPPAADPRTLGPSVVIVGGGPGGYEAALVAAQLGADVALVEDCGPGGNAVLTDVVPSKALISTASSRLRALGVGELGLRYTSEEGPLTPDAVEQTVRTHMGKVNARVVGLADAQSRDVRDSLESAGVRVLTGRGRLLSNDRVHVDLASGGTMALDADAILVSTGAHPRELDSARPDGERILTWKQLYALEEVPPELVVVGSGVTGAEFASAYDALGSTVTLVSSREHVLPGHDADAAQVIEDVFARRGLTVVSRCRAEAVRRAGDGVEVDLSDGRTITGSHCLMAVGAIPNTSGIGLEQAGVRTSRSGHVEVDGVSRTTARGVYAAGDCTGVMPLASVAAMQGRIAMWHALGDAVSPLRLHTVSSTIFTHPQIATVGQSQDDIEAAEVPTATAMLPLASNPRAKMEGIHDGFVKLFCRVGSGTVIGGVVVAPIASELIFPVAVAVDQRLTVDQLAHTFTVYPSLSGSIAEAARRLRRH